MSDEKVEREKMKLFTTILSEICAIFSAPRIPDLCTYANTFRGAAAKPLQRRLLALFLEHISKST